MGDDPEGGANAFREELRKRGYEEGRNLHIEMRVGATPGTNPAEVARMDLELVVAHAFAAAGGLMTWAPDLVDQFRMAADYVDQILKGAKPGDLPLRHPSRYYLTLNKTAARTLGLAFPPDLLAKADRVLP
jgi:hypothetical protein